MPGIAGLLEGIRFVKKMGTDHIADHERQLTKRAAQILEQTPGIHTYVADDPLDQVGVLSFWVEGRDCEELGEGLARRGIAVRSGLHCAPLAHRTAGTLEHGTVRLSFSALNTLEQMDCFAARWQDVLREKVTF